jgi:quinol monooxygenase YgiN
LVANDNQRTMSNVVWVFSVAIKGGQANALKALVREMSDACRANEPETLIYEWTISEDGTTAQVHERYVDPEAALRHLASFNQDFAGRLMALVEPTGMTIYGNTSAALKKELAGAEPTYMTVIGGFIR